MMGPGSGYIDFEQRIYSKKTVNGLHEHTESRYGLYGDPAAVGRGQALKAIRS